MESRRGRGCDVDIPRRRIAATPRPRRARSRPDPNSARNLAGLISTRRHREGWVPPCPSRGTSSNARTQRRAAAAAATAARPAPLCTPRRRRCPWSARCARGVAARRRPHLCAASTAPLGQGPLEAAAALSMEGQCRSRRKSSRANLSGSAGGSGCELDESGRCGSAASTYALAWPPAAVRTTDARGLRLLPAGVALEELKYRSYKSGTYQ